MRTRLLLPLLLCLLGGGGLAPRAARADDLSDARAAFREQMKEEDWTKRKDAFLLLTEYDGEPAVREILTALRRETNGAVLVAGLEALSYFASAEARQVLIDTARKGKDREQLLVLVALERQSGPEITEVLLDVARGRDAMAAAQAALALGGGETMAPEARPILHDLLRHKDWQVRSAAARSLGRHPDAGDLAPLAAALEKAEGRDRTDLVLALAAAVGQDFGYDPGAWARLAAGEDPAQIPRAPELPPSAFGVPFAGQRVVVVLDNSLRMSDPLPFGADRLRELCEPPDGAPIAWFRMKTNGSFAYGHVQHLVRGLPRGAKVGLITFNAIVQDVFPGLISAGKAADRRVEETLDALIVDDGIASYDALRQALDIAGAKDSKAWKAGPDEILFVTVNMPTAGEVKEADVVAAAIGLEARLRMVPIHTVGISNHPYDMCRELAARTGGTYVSLVK